MKTSVIKLRHRTGTSLTLIGMSHIGTESYYENVKSLLKGKVLYEMIKGKSGVNPLSSSFLVLAEVLNLKTQAGSIPIKDDWVNSDISYQDIVFCEGENILKRYHVVDSDLIDFFKDNKEVSRGIIRATLKIMSFFKRISPHKDHVLLDLRNNRVIADIIKYGQSEKRITVTYGEDHIEGILKQLSKIGFIVIGRYKMDPFQE